jgi:hypothetical protein
MITPKMKPAGEASNCCGAEVKVVPENAGRGETQFYQCQKCNKPCDSMSTGEKVLHAQVFWKAGFNTEGAYTQEQLDDPKVEKYTILGYSFMPDKPAGDVCKAHLVSDIKVAENGDKYRTSTSDFTDAAYDDFDTRDHNLKLWIQDMREWLKGANINKRVEKSLLIKLNDLEEI